jgi:Fic family protein
MVIAERNTPTRGKKMYIHQHANWNDFTWNDAVVQPLIAQVRYAQGRLVGRMEALGHAACKEANLNSLTHNIVRAASLEGERPASAPVRAIIIKKLGLETETAGSNRPSTLDGLVGMMLDATYNYNRLLTKARLCHWQTGLFVRNRNSKVILGRWRGANSGAIRIVSGEAGAEVVHYEAPHYGRLEAEMAAFIKWFNTKLPYDPIIAAAIAHLWFLSLHPFDDGNTRLACALSDMMLARADKHSLRFYSLASQIKAEESSYCDALEAAQKGTADITEWVLWFTNCVKRAVNNATTAVEPSLKKMRFWEKHNDQAMNTRQRELLNRLIEGEFKGKVTLSNWASTISCATDIAARDMTDLLQRGFLIRNNVSGSNPQYAFNAAKIDA